jgi:hypothetical protein
MLYGELADLIITHKQQTAQQAAQELLARGLANFTNIPVELISSGYMTSLEVFANYLRDGDIKKYSEYVQEVTRQQHDQGFSIEDIVAIGDTLAANVNQLVEKELSGPENASGREKFNKRLNSLSVLGRATALNSNRPIPKGDLEQ